MNSGQLPLWSPQANHSRFDNFHVEAGSANALLVKDLRAYLLNAETTPFYFYGESGAGKTHLHIAASNLFRELGNSDTVYIDCASESAQASMLTAFIDASCLCLDNIDAWSGSSEAEQAIFAVVEKAKNSSQRLIVSAKQSPKNNAFDLADLVSRLASGVVYELFSLKDAGKLKVLQKSLEERDLKVDEKVIHYLLTHFSRDNHSLFDAIKKLDRASLIEKRKLTIPFVQKILAD